MAQIAYVDWDGLVYYDGKIKDYISNNLEDCFKDGGKVLYSQLPTPGHNNVNTVFTVEDDFTRTEELFGVNGGVYNKGTAVKVTEVSPGQYFYTILVETRNPSDVETFDDIYAQIKELKDAVDSFNPESSEFYNKSEIDEKFAETKIELDRQDKRIDQLAADQSEDHRTLCDLIANGGANVNLDNYYNKEESDAKFVTFADLAKKADSVLFTDSEYEVTNAVGEFEVGDIVSNIDVKDLFTRILGLQKYIPPVGPSDPDSIITKVIENEYSFYALDDNGELKEVAFNPISVQDKNADITDSGFYQMVNNDIIEEAGYQDVSPDGTVNMIYYVALPRILDLNSNTDVYYYSALSDPKWVCGYSVKDNIYEMIVTTDLNKIVEIHGAGTEFVVEQLQTVANSLPEDYRLWLINAEYMSSGASYRFVIRED